MKRVIKKIQNEAISKPVMFIFGSGDSIKDESFIVTFPSFSNVFSVESIGISGIID